MVIGKLKYLMEPAVEHTPHCLVYGHARVQGTLGRWACSVQRELKGKVAWAKRDVDSHACVLGLPGQVNKFDSNRPLLTVWDCLISLPHRVTRATLL